MALSLWISPEMQYGMTAPGEARTGAYQRAVEQALKRFLFEDRDATAATTRYDEILRRFDAALTPHPSFGRNRPAAERLWRILLPSDTPPESSDAAVPERVEGLFCFVLHGLCAALARQTLAQPGADQSDPDDDADDDDADEPAASANLPGVEYAETVRVLAEQLRRLTARRLRRLPEEERPENDDWNLVARLLLEPLLASFGDDWFRVGTGETRHRDGKPHTEKRIESVRPELARRIERLLETLPLSFSPQPLKQPAAYFLDDPGPSDDEAELCSRVDLIGYRQTNDFLRRLHRDIQCPEYRPPNFQHYVAAVNVQQAVHWRINRPLLQWTRRLVDRASTLDPKRDPLGQWIHRALYRPAKGARKTFERPAEFLDSPLARRALDELCPSDPQHEPPPFYLPWKADHRGRIYAETPWFTPQGGDLQRALLEFARGQALDESGVRALRRHGANLVQRSRLLEDLGIGDRQVVTLDERERWTLDHEADILASAADPLAAPFWRDVADKPMQFLAFCLAYRQWKAHPEAPIHLPVQIDGTCNGIQHIAALTGDASLAEAVNVLPRTDGLPADIYSELAEAARTTLGRLPAPERKSIHHDGLALADAWLAAAPDASVWLNRKTAKGVVMTIPYGASRGAQARRVLEAIEGQLAKVWDECPPNESELAALVASTNAASARKDFVRKCTRGLFTNKREAAFPKQDEHTAISIRVSKPESNGKASRKTRAKSDAEETWTPERAEWERLRTFGAYVALALVEHLRGALDRNYPKVGEFSAWLGEVAASVSSPRWTEDQLQKLAESKKSQVKHEEKPACLGLPLLWLTPLGFPVAQNKFALAKKTSVSAQLGGQSIKFDVQRLTETVDPQKQRDALLPNLIHSLDATHLTMTLLEARARGVHDLGSVHDCLLCHPNQAEILARTVRATFAALYAPDENTFRPRPLHDWHGWMAQAVALRTLPRRGEILGALEQPGGLGERVLEHDADAGHAEAVAARAWLARIRERTPAPERFLLGLLLKQAVALATPAPPPARPDPPTAGALPLSDSAISPYFFS